MITIENMPEIIELYLAGVGMGAFLSGIVWAIGYGIQAFLGFLKSAT